MKNHKPSQLSLVEFALLQLLAENGQMSGYSINQVIEERGYREWADIGTTSIYVGLEKLLSKQLVESYVPGEKQGKGPLPRIFSLTEEGKQALRLEIVTALSTTRERERRFDLALAAMPFIDNAEVLQALERRKEFLVGESERINRQFLRQGGQDLPLHVQLLFRHSLIHIAAELEFTTEIIHSLKNTQETRHDHP